MAIDSKIDSNNLRQKKRSIHKKVPLWKDKLDSRIRMELGRAAEAERLAKATGNEELLALQHLHEKGIITDAELTELKGRIIDEFNE